MLNNLSRWSFSNRKISVPIKNKVFEHYFLAAISILQKTEVVNGCYTGGHTVILYTEENIL